MQQPGRTILAQSNVHQKFNPNNSMNYQQHHQPINVQTRQISTAHNFYPQPQPQSQLQSQHQSQPQHHIRQQEAPQQPLNNQNLHKSMAYNHQPLQQAPIKEP